MDFKCFVIDLDGVVYRGNKMIEGVDKKINCLKKKASVIFLTNNSTLSRASYAKKLNVFGIRTQEDEIITSGYVAAKYIKERYENSKVFVIGEKGLKDELSKQKITLCDDKCNVVLVGLDRAFTYEKLATALQHIQQGAAFIATNTDNTLITGKELMPGAGAIVGALTIACKKEPIVMGKPSKVMADVILKEVGVDPGEVLLIGDRLETDIKMGRDAGMKTALVLTGYATREEAEASAIKPDFVIDEL